MHHWIQPDKPITWQCSPDKLSYLK